MLKESEILGVAGTGGIYPAAVKFIEGGHFHLKFSFLNSIVKAKQAFSCLFEPLVDDEVMAYLGDEEVYILAILNRKNNCRSSISLQQPIEIKAPLIALNATELTLNADQSRFHLQHSKFEGNECSFHFHRLKFFAKTIEEICDTFNLQAIRLFQWVEDLEHQVLGRLRSIIKRITG